VFLTMMDLLLISPPVANIGQAAASISVLTAFLRSRGWKVGQWDAAIDAFHFFHSAQHLSACRDALAAAGADAALKGAATRAADTIEAAKRSLVDPRTVADTAAMERAFAALEVAGHVLTAVGLDRYQHTYRDFTVHGGFRDFAALEAALEDRAANPYLAWTAEHAIPRILESSPRAVGISITYLSQLIPGFTLARMLRRVAPRIRLVIGGGYLTALGEEARAIPKSLAPVDAIILHDGEDALDAWLRGEEPSAVSCTDLAKAPSPCWIADGLELSRYLVPRYAIPLPLTRGCHWGRCRYCNISAQTSSSYRVRPIELALADIRAAMAETGSNWFDFPVDSFRPDHLHQLARALIDNKLEVRWAAEVLMDRGLTTEVIGDLARSGCRCLRFGMESASDEVLVSMSKPRLPGLALRILGDCRQAGIRTGAMLILGYPTETQRQRTETFEFLADHHDVIDFVALHEFNLVPGSPLARDPAQAGIFTLPRGTVLQPAIPYRNANQVGLDQAHISEAATAMRDALREFYPHLGQPWAVAIGGWMTFAWCCLSKRTD